MRSFLKPALAATVVVVFAGSLASANFWNHNKSGIKTADVVLGQDAKIANGPELKAGDYKVELLKKSPVPQIAFYQNGNLIFQTTAKLVNAPTKNDDTKVFTTTGKNNAQIITEVDPNGWNQNIIFPNSNQKMPSAKPRM
jgi:hypothetical protein